MPDPKKYNSIPPGALLPRTQVPEGPPGLLSRFFNKFGPAVSQVFGGVDDPRLSPEENQRARRQAMIQSGLATIMAANQSGATALGSVAAGAMHGQQAGGALREQTYGQGIDVNRRRMYEDLVKGGEVDVPMLRRLFTQAIASGDTEGAKAISQVLQVADGSSGGLDTGAYMVTGEGVNPQTGKEEKYLMDRRTGQVKWTGIQVAPTAGSSSLQIKDGVNKQGQPEQYAFNPATGEVRWLGIPPIPSGSSSEGRLSEDSLYRKSNQLWDDYYGRVDRSGYETSWNVIDTALNPEVVSKAHIGDGAAKVALLYAFVKALDPNSVVREGEVKLTKSAEDVWSKMDALKSQVDQGESPVISNEMVNQMVSIMEGMKDKIEERWQRVYDQFDSQRRLFKLPPDIMLPPPFLRNGPGIGDPSDPFGALGGGR